jgi:hypothetical protein
VFNPGFKPVSAVVFKLSKNTITTPCLHYAEFSFIEKFGQMYHALGDGLSSTFSVDELIFFRAAAA